MRTHLAGGWGCVVLGVVTMVLWLDGAGHEARAESIVLFTASTDFTGNVPDGGFSYPNDPLNQNPFLPATSSGVTLTPASGGLNNTLVGPLPDGTTYGPFGFNQNAGGTTGFITSTFTFAAAGRFQLVWEVAAVAGAQGGNAVATDNITLNGNKLVQFQSGGTLPSGYTGLGSFGTSASVPGLATTGGDTAFAWIDVQPGTATGVAPIFDTSGDVFSASQLFSAAFDVNAGDVLSVDVAFMTSDGSPFSDYGAVALFSVPEPSSVILAAIGLIGTAALAVRHRRGGPLHAR
jgi:PEP-CTERM motif